MKIGLVLLNLNTKGGTQRQGLSLAQAFMKLGHEVSVYTFKADYEHCYGDLMRPLVIKEVLVPSRPEGTNLFVRKLKRKRHMEAAAFSLAQALPSDLDVLNCQDDESYKVAYYFKKLNQEVRTAISWTMNDPPISYRPKPTFLFETGRCVFNFFDLAYERPFLRAIRTIFVLDRRNQLLVKSYYGREAVMIGSGVDVNYFYQPTRPIPHDRPVRIIGIGIFARYRRFEDIIEAGILLHEAGYTVEVRIAGDENGDLAYARELYERVKAARAEKYIHFLGTLSEKELLDVYHTSDIFIFPNHMQTFGLAPAEAMAAGMPVVISRTSGFSDFLKNGENACIVDPLKPHAIAAEVKRLIDDKGFHDRVAEAGQRFVKEQMTWEKRAEEMLAYSKK